MKGPARGSFLSPDAIVPLRMGLKISLADVIQFINHINARCVAAAFETCVQERIDDFECDCFADRACAESEHVCVVVFADHPGGEGIGAGSAADTFDLVGRHHDALARTAEHDAKIAVAAGDAPRRVGAAFGVGCALRCIGTDILDMVTPALHMRGNFLAQLDGGVVAGEDNTFFVHFGAFRDVDLFWVMNQTPFGVNT